MFLLIILVTLFLIKNSTLLLHPHHNNGEFETYYWTNLAKTDILQEYNREDIYRRAKNLILFVGAGMGVSTITPARILKGQLQNYTGEEEKLFFEHFPNICFLKTYSVNSQVPDAAASATALLSGVKTNIGVLGVTAKVKKGESNCESVRNNSYPTIFELANDEGKSIGIVTTGRLTRGTTAASYAKIADNEWEDHIPNKFVYHPNQDDCKDIGRQLIEENPGKNLNVILGGGGSFLYPKNYTDHISGRPGQRKDGLNLIKKWMDLKNDSEIDHDQYRVAHTREDLLELHGNHEINYLFGVFNDDRMNFDKERNVDMEPSLEEMTEAALKVLQRNEQGFFLLVEAGLIDVAHHQNYANLALFETLALDRAIEKAFHMVSMEDTLIVVTADHSQALTMNGYPPRGHDIMGTVGNEDKTNKPFTTLMYGNGPGLKEDRQDQNSNVNTSSLKYKSHSAIYLESSHHSGEDVALYAVGPMSHLFRGTKQQSYVAHAVQFAACLGSYSDYDHCSNSSPSLAIFTPRKTAIYLFMILLVLLNAQNLFE